MANPPLRIAFLWHMHQPRYCDPRSGVYALPWVRLHGVKDYYDMVARLDDFSGIKLTFNLVPCLIEQIQDYVQAKAIDRHLELSRKAAVDLDSTEKVWMIQHFFLGNWRTMVEPYPRFCSLFEKCGALETNYKLESTIRALKPQDLLDLQVWSNLTWIGPVASRDPLIIELHRRQRNFTESMKNALLDKQLEILARILPKYKELRQAGRIEISTSPYFHPILPLLCDPEIARIGSPQIELPSRRLRLVEDAERQIQDARRLYHTIFDCDPKGFWPPEAAVSTQSLQILASGGATWVATDEGVLEKTFGEAVRDTNGSVIRPDLLYRPHIFKSEQGQVKVLFRDRLLSDLISFQYPSWTGGEAVEDFMTRLESTRKQLGKDCAKSVVLIAMDGENCWEFYDRGGDIFLSKLYAELEKADWIETVTVAEGADGCEIASTIEDIYPASWINNSLDTWIGGKGHNTAWSLLYDARSILEKNKDRLSSDASENLWQSMFAAEGSDWFWWYDHRHVSRENPEYDALFRSFLRHIYEGVGEHVPHQVLNPIAPLKRSAGVVFEPVAMISPRLDGRVTTFYEWKLAGLYESFRDGAKGIPSARIVNAIYFGFDQKNIYLRIDTSVSPQSKDFSALKFRIEFEEPIHKVIEFQASSPRNLQEFDLEVKSHSQTAAKGAALEICELAIPLEEIGVTPNQSVSFRVAVMKQERVIERRPMYDLITMVIPGPDFEAEQWSAL